MQHAGKQTIRNSKKPSQPYDPTRHSPGPSLFPVGVSVATNRQRLSRAAEAAKGMLSIHSDKFTLLRAVNLLSALGVSPSVGREGVEGRFASVYDRVNSLLHSARVGVFEAKLWGVCDSNDQSSGPWGQQRVTHTKNQLSDDTNSHTISRNAYCFKQN